MSGQQEEDKKPGDQSAAHINLKVKGQVSRNVQGLFFLYFDFHSINRFLVLNPWGFFMLEGGISSFKEVIPFNLFVWVVLITYMQNYADIGNS